MTRTVRRLRLRLPFFAGSVATTSLIRVALSLALGLMAPTNLSAAKVDGFLTHEDIRGRLILDQNGQQITLPSAHDRHPELASGSVPTYLAIPLHGGEHLPGSIPTLETGSQAGQNPVGPLNFDSIVKTNLDTTLATSKLAVVDTPSQNYLVEHLQRNAHSHSRLTVSKATHAATTTVNQLNHLLNSGSNQFNKLTQTGMNDLAKLLHINGTKSANSISSLKPMLNLEAQTISGEVLPVPAPEPSTWMIFAGLLAGGAFFRQRLGVR